MAAELIQLSDRRAEPRMEAIAFLDETEKAVTAMRVLVRRDDLVGVDRIAKRLEQMVIVGREELDRLTLTHGGPEAA